MKIIAFILVVICSPIMALIGLGIYLESGNNVLFKQKRVGKNKTDFIIYKFKTIENNKVTNLGRVIRKLGLDEIPQLLNIIKGEMAFVGPRPLTQYDINRLEWDTPEYNKRWNVKPGITGKAQLTNICSAELSMKNDLWYIDNKSFFVDIGIIIKSILVPLIGKRTT